MKKYDRTRIEQLRAQHGLSVVEFARQIGTSRQAVENWESGNNKPQIDMLIHIANVFGTQLDYFCVQENVCTQCTEQEKEHTEGGE